MRRNDKYAFIYLLALLPFSAVAIAWSISGLPSDRVDTELIIFLVIMAAAAAQLRIKLPKANLYFSLADPTVLFSLAYFGVELAVVVSAAAAFSTSIISDQERRSSVVAWMTNVCIATI